MLTVDNVAAMISIIKANYTYAYRDIPERERNNTLAALIATWHECLMGYDEKVVSAAFRLALKACKFPPTIADIVEQINALVKATDKSDAELWNELTMALSRYRECSCQFNYTYTPHNESLSQGQLAQIEAQKVYDGLSPKLKEYCGGYNGFADMALLDDEGLSYEKGRFLKAVPQIEKRIETKRTTPPELLEACKGATLEIEGKL